MNDDARRELCALVRRHGREFARDARQARAALTDVCPAMRREVNVLSAAVEQGAARRMLDSQGQPWPLLAARLAAALAADCALDESAARWAVDAWGEALGLCSGVSSVTVPLPASGAAGKKRAKGSWRWASVLALAVVVAVAAVVVVARPFLSADRDETSKPTPKAGVMLQVIHEQNGSILRVVFSDDGKKLAALSGDGKVRVWEVPSGKFLRTVSPLPGWEMREFETRPYVPVENSSFGGTKLENQIGHLGFSEDGAQLIYLVRNTEVDKHTPELYRQSRWSLADGKLQGTRDWADVYAEDANLFKQVGRTITTTNPRQVVRIKYPSPYYSAASETEEKRQARLAQMCAILDPWTEREVGSLPWGLVAKVSWPSEHRSLVLVDTDFALRTTTYTWREHSTGKTTRQVAFPVVGKAASTSSGFGFGGKDQGPAIAFRGRIAFRAEAQWLICAGVNLRGSRLGTEMDLALLTSTSFSTDTASRWQTAAHSGAAFVTGAPKSRHCLTCGLPPTFRTPDGRRVRFGPGGEVRLWDLQQKRLVKSYAGGFVPLAALSPDGRHAALVSYTTIGPGATDGWRSGQGENRYPSRITVLDLDAVPAEPRTVDPDADVRRTEALGRQGRGLAFVIDEAPRSVQGWKAASDRGEAPGLFLYGLCLLTGAAVESDLSTAADLIERAADKGLPIAASWAGLLYQRGIGGKQDAAKAQKWLGAAAEKGETQAMRELGRIEIAAKPGGPPPSLLLRAAEKGDLPALYDLATGSHDTAAWARKYDEAVNRILEGKD